MDELEGVRKIHSRLIHAKILVVDDDFKDTEDEFLQRQADIIITKDGIVIKSRLTRVPIDADLDKCEDGGQLDKLRIAIIDITKRTRRIELD